MAKATDFSLLFRTAGNNRAVYRTADGARPELVQGPKSALLKFSNNLCGYCNSTRTQPYDQAWETFAGHVVENGIPVPGAKIDLALLFGSTYQCRAKSLHLYFVKQLGCHAVAHSADIPVSTLAVAMLANTAYPNLFIDFIAVDTAAKSNDLVVGKLKTISVRQSPVYAIWEYVVGNLGVLVSYIEPQWQHPALRGWHPDFSPGTVTLG